METHANPAATEHQRGLDGLYANCDTSCEFPPPNMGLTWRKTKRPATSPEMGTPAWKAWAQGEEIWEPVYVLKR